MPDGESLQGLLESFICPALRFLDLAVGLGERIKTRQQDLRLPTGLERRHTFACRIQELLVLRILDLAYEPIDSPIDCC